jgi:hypothetical protein
MSTWRWRGLEWVSFGVDMVDTSGASVEISRRDRQLCAFRNFTFASVMALACFKFRA